MGDKNFQLLPAKLKDAAAHGKKRQSFLGFLDENELAFSEDYFRRRPDATFLSWGGYEIANRKMLGFFPEYLEPTFQAFPIAAITFLYREEDGLTHRDFLGSLMALGIERSVIGDMLIEPGKCVAFVREEMQEYILSNIRRIGKTGVRMVPGIEGELPSHQEFLALSGVIASPRIDCMVAFLGKSGREQATGLISSGLVQINHREIISNSAQVSEGDIITIRGKGKFMIDALGPLTSKGRLSVKCRKYK